MGSTTGVRADDVILRLPAVQRVTGLGKSTIYKILQEEDSGFPRPVRLGKRCVGFWRSEVLTWLDSCPRL